MTDREELAELIASWDRGFPALDAADEILARWRLVPVDKVLLPPIVEDFEQRQARLCGCGGADWDGHISGCPHAWQHRAADELTHHDHDAGIYGDICQCGEGAEHTPRIHP